MNSTITGFELPNNKREVTAINDAADIPQSGYVDIQTRSGIYISSDVNSLLWLLIKETPTYKSYYSKRFAKVKRFFGDDPFQEDWWRFSSSNPSIQQKIEWELEGIVRIFFADSNNINNIGRLEE